MILLKYLHVTPCVFSLFFDTRQTYRDFPWNSYSDWLIIDQALTWCKYVKVKIRYLYISWGQIDVWNRTYMCSLCSKEHLPDSLPFFFMVHVDSFSIFPSKSDALLICWNILRKIHCFWRSYINVLEEWIHLPVVCLVVFRTILWTFWFFGFFVSSFSTFA